MANSIMKFHRQGGKCAYCKVDLLSLPFNMTTSDHTEARSRGGRDTVICCSTCNQLKRDYALDKWLEWIGQNAEAIRTYNETFRK